MPRLMSVTLTKAAVYERRKTVTRRSGWTMLQPGDVVTLCEKVMGRRAGDPLVRICNVRILSARRERIDAITDDDVYREGFTDDDLATDPVTGKPEADGDRWAPAAWFVAFYCHHMRARPSDEVTRIEWVWMDGAPG